MEGKQETMVVGIPNQSGNGSNRFRHPRGSCVDRNGHMFFSDSRNHCIQKFKIRKDGGISVVDCDRYGCAVSDFR